VLIDPPRWPAHGRVWSHLVSDAFYTELHAFAADNGIPERGFDHDHYDVPGERYQLLIDAGAVPVDSRELLQRIGAAGLRKPKRDRRSVAQALGVSPPAGARTPGSARAWACPAWPRTPGSKAWSGCSRAMPWSGKT